MLKKPFRRHGLESLWISLNLSESPRSGGAWVSEVAEVAHHALVAQCLGPKDWATTDWWANMEVETHIIPVILGFSINHPALGGSWGFYGFPHGVIHVPYCPILVLPCPWTKRCTDCRNPGEVCCPTRRVLLGSIRYFPVSSGVVEKFGKSLKNALFFTGKIVDFPATLMTPEVFCALDPGLPAISWETDRIPTCFIRGITKHGESAEAIPSPMMSLFPK